jgi:hypothetical protein
MPAALHLWIGKWNWRNDSFAVRRKLSACGLYQVPARTDPANQRSPMIDKREGVDAVTVEQVGALQEGNEFALRRGRGPAALAAPRSREPATHSAL